MKMKTTCTMRGNLPLTRTEEGSDRLKPRLDKRESLDGQVSLSFMGGDVIDPVKLEWPGAVVDYLTKRGVLLEMDEDKPSDNEAAEDLPNGSGTKVTYGLSDGQENSANAETVAGAGSAVATNEKEEEAFDF